MNKDKPIKVPIPKPRNPVKHKRSTIKHTDRKRKDKQTHKDSEGE